MKFLQYPGFSRKDEREIHDFAGRVPGKVIRQEDDRLSFRLPGGRDCITEVVVRDVLYVEGAHNSLTESRLIDQGIHIVPVDGFIIKIYDKAPAMGTGRGCQRSLVPVAPQVGGLFRFDVDIKVVRKDHWSRYVSRDKRYTAPNAMPNEYTFTDIVDPE